MTTARGSKTTAAKPQENEEVATAEIVQSTAFTENALRSAESFTDLLELTAQQYGAIVDADKEIGDGFRLVENLAPFQNVPVLLMEWTFRNGDFGTYVSIRFAAQAEGGVFRGIYNDGSTGICKQLQDYTERSGKSGGLMVRGGFRVSEYDYTDERTGQTRPAKTWYLNA